MAAGRRLTAGGAARQVSEEETIARLRAQMEEPDIEDQPTAAGGSPHSAPAGDAVADARRPHPAPSDASGGPRTLTAVKPAGDKPPVEAPSTRRPRATRGAALTSTARPLAARLPVGAVTRNRSLTISRAALDLARTWEARGRLSDSPLTLPALFAAAFSDLPDSIEGVRELVDSAPPELLEGGRFQTSSRLTDEVFAKVTNVAFVLRVARLTRDIPPWMVLSAALGRQLRAEGIEP